MWQGLMRDLEQREKRVNTVQATGDKLLREGHPARSTIEARLLLIKLYALLVKKNGFLEHTVIRDLSVLFVGFHCSSADSVELVTAAVLLHWDSPQREHCILPGIFQRVFSVLSQILILVFCSCQGYIGFLLCATVLCRCKRSRGEDEEDSGDNEEEIYLWSLYYCHTSGRPCAGCCGGYPPFTCDS